MQEKSNCELSSSFFPPFKCPGFDLYALVLMPSPLIKGPLLGTVGVCGRVGNFLNTIFTCGVWGRYALCKPRASKIYQVFISQFCVRNASVGCVCITVRKNFIYFKHLLFMTTSKTVKLISLKMCSELFILLRYGYAPVHINCWLHIILTITVSFRSRETTFRNILSVCFSPNEYANGCTSTPFPAVTCSDL